MAQTLSPDSCPDLNAIREAVCIHTNKIFDSCRDKDCVDAIPVYLTSESATIVSTAIGVRPRKAEIIFASVDVEEVSFNRGYYSVDVRFFYRIFGEAYTLANRPIPITGLAIFDKRVILFGSEGRARVFSSASSNRPGYDRLSGEARPRAVVEAVDPIILSMKLVDVSAPVPAREAPEIPEAIAELFGGPLQIDNAVKGVEVTLGQFSLIRLERDTQLLMPAYDYCIPEKECAVGTEEDPCALFHNISFPVDEFFPPDSMTMPECYRDACAAMDK